VQIAHIKKRFLRNARSGYTFSRREMTTATGHRYIVNDDQILGGETIIRGTRTPVRAIVETWRLGVAAEEIPNCLPHLTLAQVFDALSYYSDHQDEINAHIERNRIPNDRIDPLPGFSVALSAIFGS
jgi:uncharacterized protein (DUF433 family)